MADCGWFATGHAVSKKVGSIFVVALICALTLPTIVEAQIDPKVLDKIQGNLGVKNSDPGAQLDQSREDAASGFSFEDTYKETEEERELKRQQSRALLDELYRPSTVEKEFQTRLGDPSLRQFGYDLFRSAASKSGPLTGQVADNYVLGPGDELIITFQGATNDTYTARVARDGRLIAGELPPIRAGGRTLGAVRTSLAAATRENLLGTDVYVSLGGVRSATVFIGGEVERPGQYQVIALSDVANALARAGGLRKSGSLRNIRIVRNGVTRTVDLYGLLGIGAPPSIGVQDGDRIIVPVIGQTFAITGAVARPGIYEMRGAISIDEALRYAGGAVRPRGYKIAISRIAEDGREVFVRAQGAGSQVIAGDGVQIVGGSAGAARDRVLLRGYVINEGPRALSNAQTVADLVGDVDNLRLGTYLPMAALIRRDTDTGMRNYEAVDLRGALTGGDNVPLRGDDRLYIFSTDDIAFMNSAAVRGVILGERNSLPQCVSLMRLEALVRDTQSPRFYSITRGTFTVEREGKNVAVSVGDALGANNGARQVQAVNQNEDSIRSKDAQSETDKGRKKLGAGEDDDNPECPKVFEEAPELLPFLIENSVSVGGSVRRPGAYPVGSTIKANALIGAADGVVASTGSVTLDLTRAETGDTSRYAVADGDYSQAQNLVLRAGDDLRINADLPAYEVGAVLLTGEFARPGLYTIRQGERLSELIARAGGLRENAYPYGTVFTRRSVRELQQEGFKRTARELNTALLALVAQKDTNSGAIASAGELIKTLSTTEAVGRMVVEADPRVLAQRPDLDPILEGGDSIFMPKKPTYVLTLGDVSNPGALQFIAGKGVSDYLAEAGGSQSTADKGRTFLVLPNGSAQPVRNGFWRQSNIVVPPGSTIIVPKNLNPLRSLGVIRDVATIFGQLATAAASIAILATR